MISVQKFLKHTLLNIILNSLKHYNVQLCHNGNSFVVSNSVQTFNFLMHSQQHEYFGPAHFKTSFPIYHKVILKTLDEALLLKEITAVS
jgi:hypothetical protein